jgi:hypothetical protein
MFPVGIRRSARLPLVGRAEGAVGTRRRYKNISRFFVVETPMRARRCQSPDSGQSRERWQCEWREKRPSWPIVRGPHRPSRRRTCWIAEAHRHACPRRWLDDRDDPAGECARNHKTRVASACNTVISTTALSRGNLKLARREVIHHLVETFAHTDRRSRKNSRR